MDNPNIQVSNGQAGQSTPAPATPDKQNTPQQAGTGQAAQGTNGSGEQDASATPTPDTQTKYKEYVKNFFPDAFKDEEQAQEQVTNLRSAALTPEDINRIVEEQVNQRMADNKSNPSPDPATLQQQVNALAPQEKANFLALVRDGKNDEAEKYLLDQLSSTVAPSIEQRVQRQVLSQVMAYTQAENAVKTFEQGFYSPEENADLAPWKEDIDRYAKELMLGLVQAKKVTNVPQYIDAHKACVIQAATALRQKINAIRGQGAQAALTRQTEVLSQTPVTPGQITPRGDTPANNAQPQTASDYIAERRRKLDLNQGLVRVQR